MPGPWKAWKSKSSFPTLSTAPWKSRKKREIPTFPQPGFAALEKWKTKSRFSTFPQPLATMILVVSLKTKNQRKEVGRYAASLFSRPALRAEPFSCSSFDWKMLFFASRATPAARVFPGQVHGTILARNGPPVFSREGDYAETGEAQMAAQCHWSYA